MITHVLIQNFRSFLDAEVELQPFSLIVGANGSGKTNLLKLFAVISGEVQSTNDQGSETGVAIEAHQGLFRLKANWERHQNGSKQEIGFKLEIDDLAVIGSGLPDRQGIFLRRPLLPWQGQGLAIFNIDPEKVSAVETTVPDARVKENGEGTAQVLDVLKNGDREDLFDSIEANFQRYVPEVEKLSLRTVEKGK